MIYFRLWDLWILFYAIHLNVRSLSLHFQVMCDFLDSFPFTLVQFDALKRGSPHKEINHFQSPKHLFVCDSHPLSTGGVGLYVKSNYLFCIMYDLKIDCIENVRIGQRISSVMLSINHHILWCIISGQTWRGLNMIQSERTRVM